MSNYVESFGNQPKLAEKYGLFVNLEKIYNKNVEKNRMGGLDMNKINVAIADDNQRTVEMMTELLEQESDIEVIASADNGEDALRIIKERQPDVVLLDIIMPKLDGIGVLEHLQNENLSKRPIIIMVSAMGQENVCEEAMDLGASYFILKPFDLRTIIKQIKQARIKQEVPERPFVSVPEKIHGLTENQLEIIITNMIHEIGVPAHIKDRKSVV